MPRPTERSIHNTAASHFPGKPLWADTVPPLCSDSSTFQALRHDLCSYSKSSTPQGGLYWKHKQKFCRMFRRFLSFPLSALRYPAHFEGFHPPARPSICRDIVRNTAGPAWLPYVRLKAFRPLSEYENCCRRDLPIPDSIPTS